ncbi:hypothetical protein GMOD_00008189 [Pyrenophora seminiperda CCB06]|uniref:Uncharacterized protein n=1 Tax=Pyrenophora seminiperda CCB06 TaxID=1302712 RepID=A0A3M7M1W7_9PLEO|nr:hypothetical protein GMOD_00008189 [Pyrenophora seminiperda CCB06]
MVAAKAETYIEKQMSDILFVCPEEIDQYLIRPTRGTIEHLGRTQQTKTDIHPRTLRYCLHLCTILTGSTRPNNNIWIGQEQKEDAEYLEDIQQAYEDGIALAY